MPHAKEAGHGSVTGCWIVKAWFMQAVDHGEFGPFDV
jgi:hypothetical protein